MEALSKDCRLHGEIGMVTLKVNGLHVVLHRLAAHVARINAHFVDVVRHEHLLVVLLFLDGFVGGGVGGVAGLEAGVRLLLLQLRGGPRPPPPPRPPPLPMSASRRAPSCGGRSSCSPSRLDRRDNAWPSNEND